MPTMNAIEVNRARILERMQAKPRFTSRIEKFNTGETK